MFVEWLIPAALIKVERHAAGFPRPQESHGIPFIPGGAAARRAAIPFSAPVGLPGTRLSGASAGQSSVGSHRKVSARICRRQATWRAGSVLAGGPHGELLLEEEQGVFRPASGLGKPTRTGNHRLRA